MSQQKPLVITLWVALLVDLNESVDKTSQPTSAPLPPEDISDFKEFIQYYRRFYVDKTLFLQEFLVEDHGSGAPVSIITKPFGFGKTMLLSTVDYFLNVKYNSTELFSGLKIMGNSPKMADLRKKHMNRYPVVKISFASVKAGNFSETVMKILHLFSDVIRDYAYLMNPDERRAFIPILEGSEHNLPSIAYSFRLLCSYIHRHHRVSPVILIDAYDTPLYSSYSSNFYQQIYGFVGSFLQGTLHEAHYARALVTGVTMVDFTKRVKYSVPFTKKCSGEYFGFTREETLWLFEKSGQSAKTCTNLEKHLGRYTFDDSTSAMFSPRAVVKYLSNGALDGGVTNEAKTLLNDLLTKNGLYPALFVQQFLAGEIPYGHIDDDLFHQDIRRDPCALLHFLRKLGFTTSRLKIPNVEARRVLREAVRGQYGTIPIPDYTEMTNELVRGDFKTALVSVRAFVENSGEYYKKEYWDCVVDEGPETVVSSYVEEIFSGVEVWYNNSARFVHGGPGLDYLEILPREGGGVPVRVRMEKRDQPERRWAKMKTRFGSFMTTLQKNETEIYIQYGKDFVDVSLRKFQGPLNSTSNNTQPT